MLVTSKELLLDAQKNGYAVGAFNTNNLEITQAIVRAAEAKRAPVLIQISAGALKYAGVEFLPMIVAKAAQMATVPVAIHLDHGPDFKTVITCLRSGFTSIMRDASKLPYAENVAEVRKVVEVCHAVGVPVEAEIGRIGGAEEHVVVSDREAAMSDPDECARFADDGGFDFLAVAIGNAHGFYKGDPILDFDRLAAIRERVSIPLVLHGASGIPDAQITRAVENGICKINIDTEVRNAFIRTMQDYTSKHPDEIDPRKVFGPCIDAMQAVVESKIEIFRSSGRA
ncbi:MAG: class II fructose-1,6-bisphosphate aldolase [Anaerolineae bacterium]|jgi:fructose-bisphosphate aldolase class II|nr:class II fructose-1,6-bisphosphate aldolase [Anaerolineae bacterium]